MRKTVKNYVYQVSYNLLNMLLPLITAPYLARILGAEGVGHYAYYFAIAQYFTIFAKLGLTHYGTRQIAEVRDHPQLLKDVFTNIYMMQIGAVTVAVAVYIGFLFLLAQECFSHIFRYRSHSADVLNRRWFPALQLHPQKNLTLYSFR